VRTAEEIAGPDGVLGQLTRRLLNRALEAELAAHLGYEAGEVLTDSRDGDGGVIFDGDGVAGNDRTTERPKGWLSG
jgi:hypothetical protein